MRKLIVALALTAVSAGAIAQDTSAIQLSLVPEVALKSRDTQINGFSLSIWGENPQKSFTLGIVNGSTGESSGFSWGAVNYAESYTGVQFAFVNYASDTFVGWQNAAVNVTKEMSGLQMGFVNYTETLNGVQLGAINIVTENPWFKDFPSKLATGFVFVNWSF